MAELPCLRFCRCSLAESCKGFKCRRPECVKHSQASLQTCILLLPPVSFPIRSLTLFEVSCVVQLLHPLSRWLDKMLCGK
eukprot:1899551-Amphidinium_carterae.1